MHDENGFPVQTYTNDEVTEYAKVWTGFGLQAGRGNIETKVGRKSGFGDQSGAILRWAFSLTPFKSNRE